MEENIINSIIDNFDYVYILMVNIITYGLIKIFDSLNGPKPVSVLAKRIITTISMIIMFCIYYFNEYENIITHYYGYLPEVSQFKYYTACKQLFLEIPLEEMPIQSIYLI